MKIQKLSLLLLLSVASATFAMDLSVSTMRHAASQIEAKAAAQVAELNKQIKLKEKESKRTFAWTRGKIESKFDARDTQRALAMYQKSLDTLEQEGLSKSKAYFTAEVVPHIATGTEERLAYNKKFVEKELVALNKKLQKINQEISASSQGWFGSWFTK